MSSIVKLPHQAELLASDGDLADRLAEHDVSLGDKPHKAELPASAGDPPTWQTVCQSMTSV